MSESAQPSLPPQTTAQQDITTAGQRKVNLIWEYTQALVAVIVVLANVIAWLAVIFTSGSPKIPEGLSNSLFLIVGFYFSRTNHAAIGGIGDKPRNEYVGR